MTPRSWIVSAVAICLCALYSFMTINGILVCIIFNLFPSEDPFGSRTWSDGRLLTLFVAFLLRHLLTIYPIATLFFAATAYSAFGVWRRREFPRKMLVICLVFQQGLIAIGFAVNIAIIDSLVTPAMPAVVTVVGWIIGVTLPVGVATTYFWFAYKLTRPEIRAEFA